MGFHNLLTIFDADDAVEKMQFKISTTLKQTKETLISITYQMRIIHGYVSYYQ